MNTKLIIKIIFALILFTAIFLAGLYISAANQFIKAITIPHIESETEARNQINYKFNLELPKNAIHLYYARRGLFTEHYAAFSLSNTDECERFIIEEFNVKLEDFKEVTELPDDFIKYGPDTWEKEYKDPAWDLKKADKYLLCGKSNYGPIIYAPEKNRFYLHQGNS